MRNWNVLPAVGAGLALGLALGAGSAAAQTLKLGWVAWSSTEMTTNIARAVLESEHDIDVEMTLSNAGSLYQGIAQGDVDAMTTAWLPSTHKDYYGDVAGKVVNLGILYGGAKLGWVVPDYIPKDKLSSIEDLKNDEVRSKLDGRIQGIDPGAGLMRKSNNAMDDYGLSNYKLVSASGAAMTAALKRAIQNDDWIVVTGWSPHWKFGAYDLRYLKDPKTSLGKAERVHVLGRQGIYRDHPKAALTLARMSMDISTVQKLMNQARGENSSYKKAAEQWVKNHQARVDYWAHNKIGDSM